MYTVTPLGDIVAMAETIRGSVSTLRRAPYLTSQDRVVTNEETIHVVARCFTGTPRRSEPLSAQAGTGLSGITYLNRSSAGVQPLTLRILPPVQGASPLAEE